MTTASNDDTGLRGVYLAKEKSSRGEGREAVRIQDRLREWLSLALLVQGAGAQLSTALNFLVILNFLQFRRTTIGTFFLLQRLITTRNEIRASRSVCAATSSPKLPPYPLMT